MRVVLVVLMLGLVSIGQAWAVDLEKRVTFEIPAQELSAALLLFAKQANVQVMSSTEEIGTRRSAGVHGELAIGAALTKLLEGTGLRYRAAGNGTIVVTASENQMAVNLLAVTQPADGGASAGPASSSLQADTSHPAASAGNVDHDQFAEIIVTAQKRGEERLQTVPIPIAVLAADRLALNDQTRLEDYFANVPGLSFQKSDYGALLSIRGLTAGNYGNPTVGILVDDVPYGATINPGYAPYAPDIDPGDLARIEVLRGPQGTLYGASSLGGLIRYVTTDPSTERLSGRLQVGTTYISRGDGPGYNLRGSLNVPLSDTVAVRMSGFTREDPGYVRNVLTGEEGVNVVRADGGRLSALWAPSEQFSLKLGALVQEVRPRGADIVDPSLGNLYSQYAVRGSGSSERRTQLYSAILNGRLGGVELVSITSYSKDTSSILADVSPIYGFFADSIFQVDGATVGATLDVDKWTQELRASMSLGSAIQWTVGAFYTDEKFDSTYNVFANDPLSGARAGSLLSVIGPSTYQEYAAFTNFTFDVTERFDIQLGGRLNKVEESFSSERSGPLSSLFYGSDPSIVPPARPDDHSFNYLLTPRFKITPDAMIYARLASGYRPGGGNINCNENIPCKFKADTSRNYEVGFKASALDRKVSIDSSLYYIDWNNIQITLFNPDFGVSYQDNVGKASSKGVELSVETRPLAGLEVSAWANYNNATLSNSLPATSLGVGNAGDRLPYSSRLSGSLSVDQEFPLWADATGSVGASSVYVGDRKGAFPFPGLPRSTFPAYMQWNLRAGIKYHAWSIDLFANNVGDKRSVIADGGELGSNLFNYTRPREVGVSLARTW